MIDADELIREYVTQHEGMYNSNQKWRKGQEYYDFFLKRMDSLNLDELLLDNINQIMWPYLKNWGNLHRVISRKEYKEKQPVVLDVLRANRDALTQFKIMRLEDTNINAHKGEIIKLYEPLYETIRPVATVKTLHLICPTFFPIWDNPISDGVRNAVIRDSSQKRMTAGDYFRFMLVIQKFLKEHDAIITDLAEIYKREKLKIIDECLWWGANRPFCLLINPKCL